MMHWIASLLSWAFLLISIGSCQTLNNATLALGGVVDVRPQRIFGPEGSEGLGPWRQILLSVDRSLLNYVYENEFNFGASFSDCKEEAFTSDNIYLDAMPVHIYDESAAEKIRSTLARKPGSVLVVTYLDEGEFQRREHVCAEIWGGNMAGMRLRAREFVIKGK